MRIMFVTLGEIRLRKVFMARSPLVETELPLDNHSARPRVGRGLTSRQVPAALAEGMQALSLRGARRLACEASTTHREIQMPVILWLLGVPLVVVVLLMLLHVI